MPLNSFSSSARLLPIVLAGWLIAMPFAISTSANEKAPTTAATSPAAMKTVSAPEAPGLQWDALSKVVEAKPGDKTTKFEFRVTNQTGSEIAIDAIQTSCGCTVAELPPLPKEPFLLAAGASTSIGVTLDLQGKIGSVAKTVTVSTTVGRVVLMVESKIPPAPVAAMMSGDRERNIAIATSDRQAIFKGDCAKCHAEPAAGKMGQELYRAVCTICHEAHPRASMIPDLHVPRGPRDLDFWTKWVTEGGPGTMMPAFSVKHGGPLNDEQVSSLALYLFAEFSRPTPTPHGSTSAK